MESDGATLLPEGVHLCSERTMYPALAENQAVRDRRAQRNHPNHPKPEVVAGAPNEAWSWDITRLLDRRSGGASIRTTIPTRRRSSRPSNTTPAPGPVRRHRGREELLPGVFRWYNNEHRHGGIGLLTPQQVHLGRAPEVGKPAEGRGAPGGGLDQPRTPRHVRQWSGSRRRGKEGSLNLNRKVSQNRSQLPRGTSCA